MSKKPYRLRVLNSPRNAQELGTNFVPNFFLPVTVETAPFIRGMLLYLAYEDFWQGTEEEVATAIDIIRQQAAEPLLTQEDICGEPGVWGANFRGMAEILQFMQGHDLVPPPWEFRLDVQGEEPNLIYMLQYRTETEE